MRTNSLTRYLTLSSFIILFIALSCSTINYKMHSLSARRVFKDEGVVQLVIAAYFGDVGAIHHFVQAGGDINYRGTNGITPIYWLISESGRASLRGVRGTLQYGANPLLAEEEGGENALIHAAGREEPEYLSMIVEAGFDVNSENTKDRRWPTAIFNAVASHRYRNIEILISHGANLEIRDQTGFTPLLSAGFGNWRSAYILLLGGADYKAKSELGAHDIAWWLANTEYCSWPGQEDWRAKVVDYLRARNLNVEPKPTSC